MADRYTTIRPRGRGASGVGFTTPGRQTRAEMLAMMRRHYERQMEDAQYVLNTPDGDFIVETHAGIYVRRNVQEVDRG